MDSYKIPRRFPRDECPKSSLVGYLRGFLGRLLKRFVKSFPKGFLQTGTQADRQTDAETAGAKILKGFFIFLKFS